jgi:hypothetical protein
VTAAQGEARQLLSAQAVRDKANAMLAAAEAGTLDHFAIDWDRLETVVDRVLGVMRARYGDFAAIPPHSRWRHFGAGGVDRLAQLRQRLAQASPAEMLRAQIDLVVTSVLLDAGAGARWRYREPGTNLMFTRSEGLAVASWHMFLGGAFSSAPGEAPLRADAAGLQAITEDRLARHFQVDADNPMVGLAGRVALLRRLGEVVAALEPDALARGETPRVGRIGDRLRPQAVAGQGQLPAAAILAAVLADLGPIWPGRQVLEGVNLGDTWLHPRLGLVPLHKLSQWLSYSLIEPLEEAGMAIVELDALTGLAEYRNGGLFVDAGLLVPKDRAILAARHTVESAVVVEWRSLTVALLDRVAGELRARTGLAAEALPLVKVLEGGTWQAGREIAAELRADGSPPLTIESDGTVF